MRNMNKLAIAGALLGSSSLAGCSDGPSSNSEIDTCVRYGSLAPSDVIVDIEREGFTDFGQQTRGATQLVEDRGVDIYVGGSGDGIEGARSASEIQTADVLCSQEGDVRLSFDGERLIGQLLEGEVIFVPTASEDGEYFTDQRGDVTDFAELDPTTSDSEE